MRLEAKKRLRFKPLTEKDHDRQLAEAAWGLAAKDGKYFRVIVFCDRRDKIEIGVGPSAQGVAEAINLERYPNGLNRLGDSRIS